MSRGNTSTRRSAPNALERDERNARALALALLFAIGCQGSPSSEERVLARQGGRTVVQADATRDAQEAQRREPPRAHAGRLVLVAGGDVEFGRMRGDRLVREPSRDDFAPLEPLLRTADVRFVNLESTISRRFEASRMHPAPLVFTAPTIAADALARGHIDVVSIANNHAWDFGADALFETLAHLERVGVAHAGAGHDRIAALTPAFVGPADARVAFLAVTSAWNQRLDPHPGKSHIADADEASLAEAIHAARGQGARYVVVSHHGGDEYVDEPTALERNVARAAVRNGADLVLGHHVHVLQRVVRIQGKPVFYGLGNLLMRMVTGKPATGWGALARVSFEAKDAGLSVCPFRIVGLDPRPLSASAQREADEAEFRALFAPLLRRADRTGGETELELGAFDVTGCAPLDVR